MDRNCDQMTVNKTVFVIHDFKKRTCRKCRTQIKPGEIVRRIDRKQRRLAKTFCQYLCRLCYVDAHGEPILEVA